VENDDICSSDKVVSKLIGIRDAANKTLLVEPEGAERDYSISEFICKEDGKGAQWLSLLGWEIMIQLSVGRETGRGI